MMNAINFIPEQHFNVSLIKPTSISSCMSYGQKTLRLNKTRYSSLNDYIKHELNNWIDGTYNPTHFLSIQLPDSLRNANKTNSITHLRNIMLEFERTLLGRHWNKKHIPFICFEEQCILQGWHFHILLNQQGFTEQQLHDAINTLNTKLKLPSYCLDLRPINKGQIQNVEEYGEKQINIEEFGQFDSDRIILSHDLFYLPYKDIIQ